MNDIFTELAQAGVEVEVDGDRLRLRGLTDAVSSLVNRVREHKEEIILAITRPPSSLAMANEPDVLTAVQVKRVCELMNTEPIQALGWVLGTNGRADEYEMDRGFSARDADLAAALDWLIWHHKPSGESRRKRIEMLFKGVQR